MASKLLRSAAARVVVTLSFTARSRPQGVIGRPGLEHVEIFAAPIDHLLEPFVPADLRLPANVALDRRGVEPIARILAEPIAGDFAESVEGDSQRLGGALHDLADRRRQRRAGVIHGTERSLF